MISASTKAGDIEMASATQGSYPAYHVLRTSGSAAAISEGSAASDNLSSLMKNSVVIFESTLSIKNPLVVAAPPVDRTDT